MERTISIGDHVKVVDESGQLHDGLVSEQWGQPGRVLTAGNYPAINVLYLSKDAEKRDPYGRQIERLSSCSHKSTTTAPGRFWYFPDEQV
jgi:hypothetical protein